MSDSLTQCITDAPLPTGLDFEQLKSDGLNQLQSIVGAVWSNYNDSDPGVTILEQLCYALTELGYCAQMPVEDVLTNAAGQIDYDNQFFEPQHILTTKPINQNDYRKLVYDRFSEVRAVYIEAETCSVLMDDGRQLQQATGRYRTRLAFQNIDQSAETRLCDSVDFLLQQNRSLGEFFYFPTVLQACRIVVTGKIYLSSAVRLSAVLQQLNQALRHFEAPQPVRFGYQQLREQGYSCDQIMNGPRMHRGWMDADGSLPAKLESVSIHQLASVITTVAGVLALETLGFDGVAGDRLAVGAGFLPVIDISQIEFYQNKQLASDAPPMSRQLANAIDLGYLQAAHAVSGVEAVVDLTPALPEGRFRDIESYYSIQNTFPEIYAIGANSLESDAADYRVASARQLKAYLLMYDQILANEFSQLAHLGKLFSFVTPQTEHGSQGDAGSPGNRKFVTSYFCQNLYAVPDIKPLLRGNQCFHYQFDPALPSAQIEQLAWQRYQQFPFNEYMHGLQNAMEGQHAAVQRREQMLIHLLARHGEDAKIYRDMMTRYQSYGTAEMTRIVVQSIWLINFQLLSAQRLKAVNLRSAELMCSPGDPRLTPQQNWWPLPPMASEIVPVAASGSGPGTPAWWMREPFPGSDGELDQPQLFSASTLQQSSTRDDVQNYSAFECKLAIVLGLPGYFLNLAGKIYGLLANAQCQKWLSGASAGDNFYDADMNVTLLRMASDEDRLFSGDYTALQIQQLMAESSTGLMQIRAFQLEKSVLDRYRAHADQLIWLVRMRRGSLLFEHQLAYADAATAPKENGSEWLSDLFSVSLMLPSYVSIVREQTLSNDIAALRALHWPSQLDLQLRPLSFSVLRAVISCYVQWNNQHSMQKKLAHALTILQLLRQTNDRRSVK